MNLKVFSTLTIDRKVSNVPILVNTSCMTNIKQAALKTEFLLKLHNFEKYFLVDDTYENVLSYVQTYQYGIKIGVQVIGVDSASANEFLWINVDLIIYAYSQGGVTHIFVNDKSGFRTYKTYSSLEALASQVLINSGQGEKHIMEAGQTEISTTFLYLKQSHKIFLNGVLQGFLGDLSDYTIDTSLTKLTYSGPQFWGGEEIFIIP